MTSTLRVPGAHLHHEIDGAGPVLVLIPAGTADADSYAKLAALLAEHYTVVRYDRRGTSRSTRDDPTQPIEVATHGDDLAHLLAAVTDDPAYVFGSSGGAVVGLDLTTRHPHRVRALVVHEPPLQALLPDGDTLHADMYQIYQRNGAEAAVRHFAASIGVDRPASGSSNQNLEFFLEYDVPAVNRFRLDPMALRSRPVPVVPAAGAMSRRYWPYRCAALLADTLGRDLAVFPGGHGGFVTHPQAFADRLHEVLTT